MSSTAKICCVCGTGVSQTKRTKDAKGRYYCEPCKFAKYQQIESTTPASALDELAYLGQSSGRRAKPQPESAASDPALAALMGQSDADTRQRPVAVKQSIRPHQPTRPKSMLPMVVIGLFAVIIIGGGVVGILAATGQFRSTAPTDDHPVAQKPTELELAAARTERARQFERQKAQDEERERQEKANMEAERVRLELARQAAAVQQQQQKEQEAAGAANDAKVQFERAIWQTVTASLDGSDGNWTMCTEKFRKSRREAFDKIHMYEFPPNVESFTIKSYTVANDKAVNMMVFVKYADSTGTPKQKDVLFYLVLTDDGWKINGTTFVEMWK